MLILSVFQKVLKAVKKHVVFIQKNIKITFLAVLRIHLLKLVIDVAS